MLSEVQRPFSAEEVPPSGPGSSTASVNLKDPVSVANGVLQCLKNGNLSGIIGLFNEANREVLYQGRSRKFLRDWEKRLEKTARMFQGVEEVAEVRELYRDEANEFLALAVKICQERHLVHVLSITREGDRFWFDDLVHPHVWEYRQWPEVGAGRGVSGTGNGRSVPFFPENGREKLADPKIAGI